MSLDPRPWIGTVTDELRVTVSVDGWDVPFAFLPDRENRVDDASHRALLAENLRITWKKEPRE